ncbi:PREDICTED: uncharacterized protein LOC108718501 [Pelobates cultripes]|uniref:PREDICTED: uncharacterized protein LOC108718501 n=1 Tax=Pelobates cultripes TaxID=61616 RepID=A0AAD1VR68_PELCU|nr:PREDICTED: uncharacterized protein LOC108718501 [Pelobates cultripes]
MPGYTAQARDTLTNRPIPDTSVSRKREPEKARNGLRTGGGDPGPTSPDRMATHSQSECVFALMCHEFANYCSSCPECQHTAPFKAYRSPLVPLPIIEIPFERIAMDLVGPLVKSARGHQYILVILDYATKYPEAIPLRNTSAKTIARELMLMFSRVGIPKEILTDQGTPFMSKVTKELCKLLQIKHLRTSVYHPQTDGLVERFNKTLKSMLRKVIDKDGKNWDCLLPYLMFSIREVPQASTGFSPFELLYAHHPRGLLDIAKETWEQESNPYRSVIEHIAQMQDRMAAVMPIVKEHMQKAQDAQKNSYNKNARLRVFHPGDRVLVLVPTVENKFLASWHGPYEVIEQVGEVNYKVRQPDRRKPENRKKLVRYLKHVNFTTAAGDKVSFDQNGDPYPSYDLVNWQKENKTYFFAHVGEFSQDESFRLDENIIVWQGSHKENLNGLDTCTSNAPLPHPPLPHPAPTQTFHHQQK